jgi:hypothetical protein
MTLMFPQQLLLQQAVTLVEIFLERCEFPSLPTSVDEAA